MIIAYLLLLVTQSYALQYTLPSSFGGKTDFSDRGWRKLISLLSPEVSMGQPPTAEFSIAQEPTCAQQITKCSTSYFGKHLTLTQPDTAQLWVKWHQDATPFACNTPEGCTITSARSVADLTSQSGGWKVTAHINGKGATNNDSPTVNGKAKENLSFRFSEAPISPKIKTSTKTLSSKCSQNHTCYIQTGTLMLTISGDCDSKPLIVCDRHYFPCEEFNYSGSNMCSQWDTFTKKYCQPGVTKPDKQQCSMNVAVIGDNGEPISFQVFEQKPMPDLKRFAKRNFIPAESPFGELPDGSSGAWMVWSPQA